MTEQASGRLLSGIDIPKTIAGTLAAVSAAVVGSFLGVAGTLVGAAVASIVGSVGTELYHRWINRGAEKVKSTFVTAPAAVGTPEVAATVEDKPSEIPPAVKIHWGKIAAAAGVFFVLAMGSLTAFELVSKKSVADAVGGHSSGTTTISSFWKGGNSDTSPTPAPSESADPEQSGQPTEEPSAPATTDESSPVETESPLPTDAPTTTGPTQAPDEGETPPGEEQPQDQEAPQQQEEEEQPQQDGFAPPAPTEGE